MEAIILAGGLGTRLRAVVDQQPKSMALIGKRPFLEYQMDLLIEQGVKSFILSVGYRSEQIRDHFKHSYKNCIITYATEKAPLGTGGAIKNAMQFAKSENVIVINGDSIVITDVKKQYRFHMEKKADATIALRPMRNFDRYGTVTLNDENRILDFLEKKPVAEGVINAGLYIFNVKSFISQEWPEKFSIEKNYFESKVKRSLFFGFVTHGYFIDIGIPSDLKKAQTEISVFFRINKDWSLFMDRDGVINKKIDHNYVKHIEELEFLPGALPAISTLSQYFGKIFIVTNQQGIGKGLMTEEDLSAIHNHLLSGIQRHGGRISGIYHAPDLASSKNIMRKPNIGMALKAKEDYPAVDFSKCIMIGDSLSDMEFGKNTGMTPVMIKKPLMSADKDYTIASLRDFSHLLKSIFDPLSPTH